MLTSWHEDIPHRKYDTILVHSSNRTEGGMDWRSRRQTWREWCPVISWPKPSIVWTVLLAPGKSPSFQPKTGGCNISPLEPDRRSRRTEGQSTARSLIAPTAACNQRQHCMWSFEERFHSNIACSSYLNMQWNLECGMWNECKA